MQDNDRSGGMEDGKSIHTNAGMQVEKFLKECMDSVVNQTLKDIEIICIDDGSRDSTGNILDEYAQKDNRIKVIHKANSGYGHSMNVGLQNAAGEYIGIIETDDFADLNMFDELYKAAKENHADVVKSNYYSYVSQPEPQSTYYEVLKEYDLYDQVFRPVEHPEIFRVRPMYLERDLSERMAVGKSCIFCGNTGCFLSGYRVCV